jgi:predicted nucleic acid-binding protein
MKRVKVYVLDASAWVKRYKKESGSNSIDALFQALEQGEVESCLLPVIYYEMFWNIQKFIRAANDPTNRSLLKYPPRRLQRVLEADSRHMTQVKDLLDSQGLLDETDGEVLFLLKKYPVGSNDALILAYLCRLQERLAERGRQLVFVCSDKDFNKAVCDYLSTRIVKNPETDPLP